jgi:hypothetical protein
MSPLDPRVERIVIYQEPVPARKTAVRVREEHPDASTAVAQPINGGASLQLDCSQTAIRPSQNEIFARDIGFWPVNSKSRSDQQRGRFRAIGGFDLTGCKLW